MKTHETQVSIQIFRMKFKNTKYEYARTITPTIMCRKKTKTRHMTNHCVINVIIGCIVIVTAVIVILHKWSK